MKSTMKGIICFVLSLMLCIGSSTISFASENEIVSSEEFILLLKEVCERNGASVDITSVDESYVRTKKDVEEALRAIENDIINAGSITEGKESLIQPYWTYNKTYTSYTYISNSVSTGAQLEISCVGKIYDGTVTFESISNIKSRQYGVATGFVSWTQNSSSSTISSDKKTADVSVEGTLVTKNSVLGAETTFTYDYVFGMVIRAS